MSSVDVKMRRWIFFFAKIVTGLALLFWVLYSIDFEASLALAENLQVKYLIFCGILLNFDRFFMGLKWSILLPYKCPFGQIIFPLTKSYFYSLLLSPVLPTTVGEDVVRGASVIKDGIHKEILVSSIVMERLLSAVSQLLLAAFTLYLLSIEYSNSDPVYLQVSLGLTVLFVLIISLTLVNVPKKISDRGQFLIPKWKIFSFIRNTHFAYKNYQHQKKEMLIFLFLSLIENSFAVLGIYWFFLSFGVGVTLYDMFLTVPAILLFSKIPVSIGALGIQEAAFVLFSSMVGISSEEAVAVSLLSRFVNIVAILPGCLFFYFCGFLGNANDNVKN